MTIYATIDDLESGWRSLTPEEAKIAETLLKRASLYLDAYVVEPHNIDVDAKADALTIVCCDLVQRKLESGSAIAVSSETLIAGPFSQTTSYANRGHKSWELYPEDLKLLGITSAHKAGTIPIAIHNRAGDEIEW